VAGVKQAVRIKGLFQGAMQLRESRRQGLEHVTVAIAVAEQGRMSAMLAA
jgi:hypothetical protein